MKSRRSLKLKSLKSKLTCSCLATLLSVRLSRPKAVLAGVDDKLDKAVGFIANGLACAALRREARSARGRSIRG